MSFKDIINAKIEAAEFTKDMTHDTKVGYIFGLRHSLRTFESEFMKAIDTFKDMKIKKPPLKRKVRK